jgi:hypothetical protein
MEEANKEMEASEPADAGNRAPAGNATGKLDCRYRTADGATLQWSIIHFGLATTYDAHTRRWRSGGKAVSDDRQNHLIELSYDESRRILTIDLNGYTFTMQQSEAMASNYNHRSTLDIKFLRDAEGANAAGDHFTIRGNSRLSISL